MNARKILGYALVLLLAAGISAGCAKKTTEVMPVGPVPVTKSEKDTDWQSSPAPQERSLTESELREQQREIAQRDVGSMIFFAFDSYELSPESRNVLAAKADALKKYPLFNIVIEGHCDERGTSEYNLALGERRAKAAQQFLNQLGITETRMSLVSYGKERPFEKGHDEAAWSKNRRDEFKIQN